MHTRKQIKTVLREWKSFLSEAKDDTSSSYVVRIFDFDGTVVTYRNQQLLDLMKNSYLYNLVNPEFMQEVKNKVGGEEDSDGSYVPKSVRNLVNSANESYICSKVKSTGFDVKIRNAFDSNLKRIVDGGAPDDKMQSLFDFIKKNSVEKFDIVKEINNIIKNANADLRGAKVEDKEAALFHRVKHDFLESPEIKKYLAIPDASVDPEQASIGTNKILDSQLQRIPQIIQNQELNIPEENIVVTKAIALQATKPVEGGGGAETLAAERGTSGKIMDVMGIAKRVIDNNPDRRITFELFDNVASNLGEMIDGVQRATPGYRATSAKTLSSQEDYLQHLKNLLKTSSNIEIKAYLATATSKGITFEETSGRVSKSKKGTAVPENASVKNFQEIKNTFFGLINTLKSKGGRPTSNSVKAAQEAINTSDFVGELTKELYTASEFASKTSETGFEEKYSDRQTLGVLANEMKVFVNNFPTFKQNYEQILARLETEKPTKRKPAPATVEPSDEEEMDAAEEADDAFWRNMTDQERDRYERGLEQKNSDDPEVVGYAAWKQKNVARLKESVRPQKKQLIREFKLVLKSKK